MARKKKPIDPATRARFKRERRCFDPEHDETIAALRAEVEKRGTEMAKRHDIIESLKERMRDMIDKSLSEEEVKTAAAKAYHEGLEYKEEELRKSKACFAKMHSHFEGRVPVSLTLSEIMSVFGQLREKSMLTGSEQLFVFLPSGVVPVKGKENPMNHLADEFLAQLMYIVNKRKGGG